MNHFAFLSHFITSAVGNNLGLCVAIILGTFLLEDPTTIIVGVLAADGVIPVPVALFSLYVGIIVGDIGMYFFGWLASRIPRLERYVDHEFTAPFRTWLETRYILTIFSARFIPGARLPTYASSGFFRSPLSTFILVAIVAASLWTTLLFFAFFWFGAVTARWVGPLRWGIAIAFFVGLFLIGRHNVRTHRKKKSAADASASF